jgi:hypothetical protein
LSQRLLVTAGYGAAALVVVAVAPALRRNPVRAAATGARRRARSARSGIDLWLDAKAAPPQTLTELLLEAVVGSVAQRPGAIR